MILTLGMPVVFAAACAVFLVLCAPPGTGQRLHDAVWRWRRKVRPVDLDQMPGHPETVAGLADPIDEVTYWDTAGHLLDDDQDPRLADVAERLGWKR